MVEIYVRLIINKRRTFAQVPERFQEQVKDRLSKYGYDIYGESVNMED